MTVLLILRSLTAIRKSKTRSWASMLELVVVV